MLHAVKFAAGSEVVVEGLSLPFGGPFRFAGKDDGIGRDSDGEYFWRGTDFCLDLFPAGTRPIMYHHGLDGAVGAKAVGREQSIEPIDDIGYWVRGQLDKRSKYLDGIQTLVQAGAIGWSSGAIPHLIAGDHKSGRIDRWPIVEHTLTPIPSNPDAEAFYGVKASDLLVHLSDLGIDDPSAIMDAFEAGVKAAIGVHHTATDDGAWDGPANEARLPNTAAALTEAHAWRDAAGDPEAKSSYKFIHHDVSGDGRVGAANLKACSSGIGILNGGRGGTTIPNSDVAGVHRHLAAHMRDGDMTPPELKSASLGGLTYADHLDRVLGEVGSLVARSEEVATLRASSRGSKEGRVLSSANRDRLARLQEQLGAVAADIAELLTATTPADKTADIDREVDAALIRAAMHAAGIS